MMTLRPLLLSAAVVASVGLCGGLSAPTALALPGQCWNSPFGGFCDTDLQPDGSYAHCESVGFGSSQYQNCFQACHDPVSNRAVPTDLDSSTPC